MKIIYLKDQSGGGKKGQIKEVSEGFAKNFLIPKGFAAVATPEVQAKVAKEGKDAEVKKQKEAARLQGLKVDLEKKVFTVKVKVGDKGQVFGGVHEKDIAKAIADKTNYPLEKNQVELTSPVKQTGQHQVKVKLGGGISAMVKINVEAN